MGLLLPAHANHGPFWICMNMRAAGSKFLLFLWLFMGNLLGARHCAFTTRRLGTVFFIVFFSAWWLLYITPTPARRPPLVFNMPCVLGAQVESFL